MLLFVFFFKELHPEAGKHNCDHEEVAGVLLLPSQREGAVQQRVQAEGERGKRGCDASGGLHPARRGKGAGGKQAGVLLGGSASATERLAGTCRRSGVTLAGLCRHKAKSVPRLVVPRGRCIQVSISG